MSELPPDERRDGPSLPSLPEDLLIDIGSRLSEREACYMELSSKIVLHSMSRTKYTWPRGRRLDLKKSLTPDAYRSAYKLRGWCGAPFGATPCLPATYCVRCIQGSDITHALQVVPNEEPQIQPHFLRRLRVVHAVISKISCKRQL